MHFKMSSAICLNLDQSIILSSGNGLMEPNFMMQCIFGDEQSPLWPEHCLFLITVLLNDRYFDLSKSKAFADNKINVT